MLSIKKAFALGALQRLKYFVLFGLAIFSVIHQNRARHLNLFEKKTRAVERLLKKHFEYFPVKKRA